MDGVRQDLFCIKVQVGLSLGAVEIRELIRQRHVMLHRGWFARMPGPAERHSLLLILQVSISVGPVGPVHKDCQSQPYLLRQLLSSGNSFT
jgi:hypothetical protein